MQGSIIIVVFLFCFSEIYTQGENSMQYYILIANINQKTNYYYYMN